MRLLLDTHVFIWAVTGSAQLKVGARERLTSAERVSSPRFVGRSPSSRLGKIEGVGNFVEATGQRLEPVSARRRRFRLPLHHADPFDRVLLHACAS